MTAPLRIRPFGPFDIPIGVVIHKAAFAEEAWDHKSITDILNMPGAIGGLALDESMGDLRPLGFLLGLFVAFDAEVLTVAVHPDHRRQGIGRALIQDFADRARTRGATNVLLEVAEDNPPARALYAGMGFIKEGIRSNYYKRPGGRTAAAYLLRMPIR